METVEVQVFDLSDAALDWAVLMAIQKVPFDKFTETAFFSAAKSANFSMCPKYSIDWSQCGPLIEKYGILVCPPEDTTEWEASIERDLEMHFGETPLIAVCRAIVSAKFGDTISIPKELLK